MAEPWRQSCKQNCFCFLEVQAESALLIEAETQPTWFQHIYGKAEPVLSLA